MKTPKQVVGSIVYWLMWPFFYFYLKSSHRTRVILVSEDKLLVVTNLIGNGQWGLPGGGLHKHELPAAGAVRELEEETGVSLNPNNLTLITENKPIREGQFSFFVDCFFGELSKPLVPKPKTKEIDKAEWIPLTDFMEKYSVQASTRELLEAWLER